MTEGPLFDPLEATDERTGPPWPLLGAAALCVVASAALLVTTGTFVDLLGYLLAAVLAVSLVGLFRYVDGRRRGRASYRLSGVARTASIVILASCWVCASAHAWFLATGWAR